MADKTGIEWTDSTWNPIRGCSRVSEGCRNCYAEKVANRFKKPGEPYAGLIARTGQWNGNITLAEHLLDQPLRWKKPRRIFVNSMSDLFHENVPFEFIDRIFAVIALCPQHTFQILTKRPERMLEYCRSLGKHRERDRVSLAAKQMDSKRGFFYTMGRNGWHLPNVWLGVSVEDQQTANERIPLLLQTPSAVRWISAEPLLGPIELHRINGCPTDDRYMWGGTVDPLRCIHPAKLDWVVVGGESGSGARPMHPDWVRDIREECERAGTAFLFKQWGEWAPSDALSNPIARTHITADWFAGKWMYSDITPQQSAECHIEDSPDLYRAGKTKAGRMLDGRTWDDYPRNTAE